MSLSIPMMSMCDVSDEQIKNFSTFLLLKSYVPILFSFLLHMTPFMTAFNALFHAVDPSLGRMSPSNLSDQALMEIVFQNLPEKSLDLVRDDHKNFLDVCDWEFITCDDSDAVTKFECRKEIAGTLNLQYLPSNLTSFYIGDKTTGLFSWIVCRDLVGSICTAYLPTTLKEFTLIVSGMSGSVELENLPRCLELFCIEDNYFCGSCALDNLPHTLKVLDLSKNNFSGSIALDKLPEALQLLVACRNELEGSITLANLPRGLEKIDLSQNKLSGVFRFLDPEDVTNAIINVSQNSFEKKAVIQGGTATTFFFQRANVKRVVDEKGEERNGLFLIC